MRNAFIGALLVLVSLCPFRTEVTAQSPFIFPPRIQPAQTREEWVGDVLKRMETVKPGMCPFRSEVVAQAPLISPPRTQPAQTREEWVGDVLKRMETIKPGMTRKELLTVFFGQGGAFVGVRRTFVSNDCVYFKVDVDFKAVARPERDQNRRYTSVEDERDVIVSISRPYFDLAVILD